MQAAEQQVTDFFLAHHRFALSILREQGLASRVCADYFAALSSFAAAVEPLMEDLRASHDRPKLRTVAGGKSGD